MKQMQHMPYRQQNILTFLIFLISLLFAMPLHSQKYEWSGGTGNWSIAGNWTPAGVPGAGDTAIVVGNVTLTGNTTVSVLNFDGGAIDGDFNLIISDSMSWSSGTLAGNGNLNISAGAVLYVHNGNSKELSKRVIENDGAIYWGGTGTWELTQLSEINNNAGATFDIIDDAFMNFVVPENGGFFNNYGTLKKSAGSGNSRIDAEFYSNGAVEATSGTLQFDRSSATPSEGAFTANNNSTIAFGRKTLNFDDLTFDGNGSIVVKDATLNASGNGITVNNNVTLILSDSDSQLDGSGDYTFDGKLEWQKGTITGSGDLFINDSLEFSGSGSKTLDARKITNNGNAVITGAGNIRLTGSAEFDNQSGAALDAQADALVDDLDGSGNVFTNAGTLEKSSGLGNTIFDIAIIHTGTMTITSGTLQMTGGGDYTAPISIGSGAIVDLDGGTHVMNNVAISGSGTLQLSSDSLHADGSGLGIGSNAFFAIAGGFADGSGPTTVSGGLLWSAGAITGSSAFSVSGGYSITGSADKILDERTIDLGGPGLWTKGDIKVGNKGQMNIQSDTLEIQTDDDIRFTAPDGGSMVNNGVILKTTNSGTCAIQLPFGNNGVVNTATGKLLFTNNTVANNAFYNAYAGSIIEFDTDNHIFTNVTADSSGTILLDNGNYTVSGIGLTVASGGNVTLDGSNATLSGSGVLTVNGTLNWDRGTISGSGAMTVNGEVVVGSANSKTLESRTFTNNGKVTWSGSGAIRMRGNASFINLANAVFDIQTDGLLDSLSSGGGSITNNGTIRKSAGSGTTTIDVPIANNDSIQVSSGTLSFTRGGSASSGVYEVGAGATLDFDGGTHNLSNISALNSGTFQLTSNTLNINGSAATFSAPGNIAITGGFFSGSADVTMNGRLNWSGGTITGSGALNLADSSFITGNGLKKLDGRSINNSGAVSWSGNGDIDVSNNGEINNLAAGIFDVQGSGEIAYQAPNGGSIDNDGLFMKTSASDSADIDVAFQNDGTIDIREGMLDFKDDLINSASGVIMGEGTLRVSNATVTNNGSTAPGASPGILAVRGTFPFSGSATFDVELGGTSAGNFDQLALAQSVDLDGTMNINLANGFIPADGDTFQVMTYSSKSGTFATLNDVDSGDNYTYTIAYKSGYILITANAISPVAVVNAKVWLEGPYDSGAMSAEIKDSGQLPLNQPFGGAPWSYGGAESVASIPADVVDWVLVEIRSDSTADTEVDTRAAFLKNDGTIVNTGGSGSVATAASAGSYYIVIYHRNHLAIMSATVQALNAASALYDFTTSQSQAYGSAAMTELSSGIFGMKAGDSNGDGGIDATDKNTFWRIHNGTGWQYGKYTDFNLNGGIDAVDLNLIWRNNNGESTQVPGGVAKNAPGKSKKLTSENAEIN